MSIESYRRLAQRLDDLPNGYPAAPDGVELRILQKLFTPEEAELASQLRLTLESAAQVAERLGREPKEVRTMLKSMAQRGLIEAGRIQGGLGYGLMPFVVGIYEMQGSCLDAELAKLFEQYYFQALGEMLCVQPPLHRVIPVMQCVPAEMEIQPYASAAQIVASSKAWGVVDCICRKQKALVGQACEHPVDVCMVLSQQPGAFDGSIAVRALSQPQALEALKRAADAGLVHTVGNRQHDMSYICNCCTCSCGILRGMADLGLANVVARSDFVNTVDEALCQACGDCLKACQFGALHLEEVIHVNAARCVGCGVCVPVCPEDALALVARPASEMIIPPPTNMEWLQERAAERGLDLRQVL